MKRNHPRAIAPIAAAILTGLASLAAAAPTVVFDFGSDPGLTSTADFTSIVSQNVLDPSELIGVSDEPEGLALTLADVSVAVTHDVFLTPATPPGLSTINPVTDVIAVDVVLEPDHDVQFLFVSFESPSEGAWSRLFLDLFDLEAGKHRLLGQTFEDAEVPSRNSRALDPTADPLERMTLSLFTLGVPDPPATIAMRIDRIAFVPEPATVGLAMLGALSFALRSRRDEPS